MISTGKTSKLVSALTLTFLLTSTSAVAMTPKGAQIADNMSYSILNMEDIHNQVSHKVNNELSIQSHRQLTAITAELSEQISVTTVNTMNTQ